MGICRLSLFILMCVSSSAISKDSGGCSDNWRQFGSVCYKIYKTHLRWKDASKFCLAKGGNLAEPKNRKENENIKKYMMEPDINCTVLWFGLIRGSDDRFHFQNSTVPLHFTDWLPGQPDNTFYMEKCGATTPIGWNDDRCFRKIPFICEKEAIFSTATISVTTSGRRVTPTSAFQTSNIDSFILKTTSATSNIDSFILKTTPQTSKTDSFVVKTTSRTSQTTSTGNVIVKPSPQTASRDNDILKTVPILNSSSTGQMASSNVTPSGTVPDTESKGHRPFLWITPAVLLVIASFT